MKLYHNIVKGLCLASICIFGCYNLFAAEVYVSTNMYIPYPAIANNANVAQVSSKPSSRDYGLSIIKVQAENEEVTTKSLQGDNTLLDENDEEVIEEEDDFLPDDFYDERELLFVPREKKQDISLIKSAEIPGIVIMLLGSGLGLTTALMAGLQEPGDNLETANTYDTLRTYDYLYMISATLLTAGTSAVYISSTLIETDRTVGSYNRWKVLHMTTGIASILIGAGALSTGMVFYNTRKSDAGDAVQDLDYLEKGLVISGASAILFGIPSFFVGILGIY